MDGIALYDPQGRLNLNDPHDVCLLEWMVYRDNPIGIIQNQLLTIKTKDGDLRPLKPSACQNIILNAIQDKRVNHLPVRIAILKARQTYTSTLCEAVMYVFCTIRGATQGLVLADDEDGASDIFKMNETFYDEMKRTSPHLTPMRKRSNERRMEFDKKKSAIRIDTARNKQAGRKYTNRIVHATECAFWPDFKGTMKALMPSVPKKRGTIVMLETTSNGKNDFYKWWMQRRKLEKEGSTDWVLIFLGWNMHEEYKKEFADDAARINFELSLSEHELKIQKDFSLTLQQLYWRRSTIMDDFDGDDEGFAIEFPLSEREAFMSTSQNVFLDKFLEAQRTYKRDPLQTGELEIVERKPCFMPDKKGFLKIYKPVMPEFQYVIGADSCESSTTHDEACAVVLCRNTWEVVAHLHGHIEPGDLAKKTFALGMYYNNALIAPERNGPGLVTVTKLAELYYPNILRTPRMVVTDGGKWVETEEFGFNTNVKTKPLIRDGLRDALRELLVIIPDEQIVDQLSTYVVQNTKSEGYVETGAEEGYYDDCVSALMIALWGCRQISIRKEVSHEVARPMWDFTSRSGY